MVSEFVLLQPNSLTHSLTQGISEIHVSSDPKFVPLCELLGAEEAERVLVFVSTSGKSKKLFLKPDPSREHRTKVIVS